MSYLLETSPVFVLLAEVVCLTNDDRRSVGPSHPDMIGLDFRLMSVCEFL